MFARIPSLFLFVLFALPLLVAATAVPRDDSAPASQCSTGSLQCCNSVQDASSAAVISLLGLLGTVLGDVTGLVGLNCAVGDSSCTAQSVCCTDNTFSGLIALGCTPVNVGV